MKLTLKALDVQVYCACGTVIPVHYQLNQMPIDSEQLFTAVAGSICHGLLLHEERDHATKPEPQKEG